MALISVHEVIYDWSNWTKVGDSGWYDWYNSATGNAGIYIPCVTGTYIPYGETNLTSPPGYYPTHSYIDRYGYSAPVYC